MQEARLGIVALRAQVMTRMRREFGNARDLVSPSSESPVADAEERDV